jgi:phenylacetate-CoA ligase
MATVYSRGRSKVKFGAKFEEHLADLQRTQWYGGTLLRELQDEKIRRVLWHARKFVPFYQKRLQELKVPSNHVLGRTDLYRLPILEKEMVRSDPSQFRSCLYKDDSAEVISTSGTTGKALQIAVASDYFKLEKAFLWLQRIDCGVRPGDRTAYFSGFPVVPTRQKRPPFWVYDAAENRMLFSVEHMGKNNLAAYAKEIERFNPLLIVGYTNTIAVLAAYLCTAKIKTVRPRGIFTSSGTLLPEQRSIMEEAFGCKVMDLYGQAEYCGMMIQCEAGSYHVKEEYGVMEIIDRWGSPTPPGEIGEIICTGLNNLAMPFIRYRTGDMAVPKAGSCSCGRGGALVERIVGRLDDVVVTPDGRLICDVMDFAFYVPNIQEAQVIQETTHIIRVRIVPSEKFTAENQARLLLNLRKSLGSEMQINLELVDQIPRLPNGKFRFVISKVALGAGSRQPGEMAGLRNEENELS